MDKVKLHYFCKENKIDLNRFKETKELLLKVVDEMTESYVGHEYIDDDIKRQNHLNYCWGEVIKDSDICLENQKKWFKPIALLFFYYPGIGIEDYDMNKNITAIKRYINYAFDVDVYFNDLGLNQLKTTYQRIYG